ncbi:DUF742 domain-containing protein [Nocardia alni]|uniref:DUF742 domain-containing protein n=1 Tax=Nocardia alni TaxID=2815723 RepID=UPI001C21C2F9|nr:DUF742 domain-containing protein [Nocardia alni]
MKDVDPPLSHAGEPQPRSSNPPPPHRISAELAEDSDEEFLRAFVVTGGRTTPVIDGLRIETLVHAPPSALSAPLQLEQLTVVRLCQRPCSIAEIGAALHVPVGIAKVIVSDLAAAGFVRVRQSQELSISAIERIRDLVRAL